MNIFNAITEFALDNHYVDVEDKIPIFICSIGAHLFNTSNRCSRCDFDPADPMAEFTIDLCPLRHNRMPFYTPMSHIPDTRIHILMEGEKGSGKNALIDLFLAEGTGLLHSNDAHKGIGFNTMLGPNSITEAGMFGSVDEDGNIVGRPLAREMCGGFLAFEEMSSLWISGRKDHSTDMTNGLLTSTDSGRVNKAMRNGWVRYTTRYTVWGGTQPARLELESGLDRRFFIIQIAMSKHKELLYKKSQAAQARMKSDERADLARRAMAIKEWLIIRQKDVMEKPISGVIFDDRLAEWIEQPAVRNFESDLFRRLAIGFAMMQPQWVGGVLMVNWSKGLERLLNDSLRMRRDVMDANLRLIKDTYWGQDLTKSDLLKEISRMITNGDYQAAKRWVEENLDPQDWYMEYKPEKTGRGRRGITCRIGAFKVGEERQPLPWGGEYDD
tara:strand:- start:6950 stop:8272 length:1323 start_codon:yes stop_codon:yes gene_type:complete